MIRNVLVASVCALLMLSPARGGDTPSEIETWTLGLSAGGQGLGLGVYVEVPLTGRSRLMLGEGTSIDPFGIGFLQLDQRKSTYLNYVHAAAEHGMRLEWMAGPALLRHEVDDFISQSRDAKTSEWAFTGGLGLRCDAVGDPWVWRLGVASIWFPDHKEPGVFDQSLTLRGYFSVGYRF